MKLNKKYETLDEYLDDLDAIKEKIAEKTSGMTTEQVIAYFNGAQRRLEKKTGRKLHLPRPGRKASPGKR
jgi:hypothetical protein